MDIQKSDEKEACLMHPIKHHENAQKNVEAATCSCVHICRRLQREKQIKRDQRTEKGRTSDRKRESETSEKQEKGPIR